MNLIYICVFHQEKYINLLTLLITSLSTKANFNKDTTEILIITSQTFKPIIQNNLSSFNLPIHYYILNLNTLFQAGCARLNIFNYNNIIKYEKILYIDTDILLNSDVNVLFNLDLDLDKIYALEEGHIGHPFWGGFLFDFNKYNINTPAFTSSVLLFKNSYDIRVLFSIIQKHILNYASNPLNKVPTCLDQPFIVYTAISHNKYDNQVLKNMLKIIHLL
jgi:lipopolysaccharide biosynthesis glycosyltransferase